MGNQDLIEKFFIDFPAFAAVTTATNYYDIYLKECVVGAELNDMQFVDGIYFVTNGVSLHICGTREDLQAFESFYKWYCRSDDDEVNDAFSRYFLLPINYTPETKDREIIKFYHRNREFYSVASYVTFREYLRSIIPNGYMEYRPEENEFYFINEYQEYLCGLPGEAEAFRRWCEEFHNDEYTIHSLNRFGYSNFISAAQSCALFSWQMPKRKSEKKDSDYN